MWRSKKEQVQDKTKTSSQVWNRPEGTRKLDNRKESEAKRQSSSDSDVRKRDMQGRYIHPLDETKGTAKLKGELFSDVSSKASELKQHPRLLNEVLLTLGPDNRRARVRHMTDRSGSVLFLSLSFDNIEGIKRVLFVVPIVDAPGSGSPHPTQKTALLAGVDCPCPSKTFGVVLQERAPRNAPRG